MYRREDAFKHVDFLILLRRLLYSENLNSPSAQTVSLSLYTILCAKFRKSAYCLQSSSLWRYNIKDREKFKNDMLPFAKRSYLLSQVHIVKLF